MKDFTGVIAVVPTPFDEAGRIDEASLERLIGYYMSLGLQGLTIMGVMGEGSKLSAAESQQLMRRIFAIAGGQIPLIVGATNPDDDALVALTEEAMSLGAAGPMISPKPGLPPADDAAVQDYFAEICRRLGPDVPICVQDYPPASGVRISAQGLADMFTGLPQLGMVKLEDNPNLAKLTEVLRLFNEGPSPRPSLFVGNNALYTELELARGADGIMTGFAFPQMLQQLFRHHQAGEVEEAARLFQAYLPLIRYESQPGLGLAARKYVLMRQGLLATAKLRAPGYDLTPEDRAEIDLMLDRLKRQQ